MTKKVEKKNVFNEIKDEAKDYYKWKNMMVRYVILWFLVILLVLQFIIPHKKILKNTNIDKVINVENNSTDSEVDSLDFLWISINIDEMNLIDKIKFDNAIDNIAKNFNEQAYKNLNLYLSTVQEILSNDGVPVDFAYLLISNIDYYPRRILDENTWLSLWLQMNEYVYEPLNLIKSTQAISEYFSSLYEKYWDWRFVLMAYSMWEYELDELIEMQWYDDFDELYFYNMDDYFTVMWYDYIFKNIDDYLNFRLVDNYDFDIKIIKVSEQKNLQKWTQKNKYSYKEIRELNPRILWNSLPKWKRELVVPN